MSKHLTLVQHAPCLLLFGVSIVLLRATLAQSFLLALREQHANYIGNDRWVWNNSIYWDLIATSTAIPITEDEQNRTESLEHTTFLDIFNTTRGRGNSTLFIYDNAVTGKRRTNHLSQATMDVVTIIWYVATFLALMAFFLLMACSDRRCNRNNDRRNAETQANANEAAVVPPLTPTPSYSEFAPPTYEAVMKMKEDARSSAIYVLPVSIDMSTSAIGGGGGGVGVGGELKTDNNTITTDEIINALIDASALPVVEFYTVDEVHKIES